MSRRDFLRLSAGVTALLGFQLSMRPSVAKALKALAEGTAPVIWLQGQSCSGCSISLLNSDAPGPSELLLQYISLKFHGTLSAATGEVAMKALHSSIDKGNYILVVEGAVPTGMKEACMVGGEEFATQLTRAARNAKAVIALGACAVSGGIPAAEGNLTGSVSVVHHLAASGSNKPLICIPGCPAHPDWLVGTLVHVLGFGTPPMDPENRPLFFFARTIHDQCNRFADYEREKFASSFGEEGCFFKLGCAGPITKADCPTRLWNSGINQCIKAGMPCIGCASDQFALKTDFPLLLKPDSKSVNKL